MCRDIVMIKEQRRRQNDSPSRVPLVGNNSGNIKWWSALQSALLRSSSTFRAVDAGFATAVATSNKPTNKRVSLDDKVTIHQFRRLTTKSSPTSSSSKDGSGGDGCGLLYIGLGRHVKTSVHSLLKMEKRLVPINNGDGSVGKDTNCIGFNVTHDAGPWSKHRRSRRVPVPKRNSCCWPRSRRARTLSASPPAVQKQQHPKQKRAKLGAPTPPQQPLQQKLRHSRLSRGDLLSEIDDDDDDDTQAVVVVGTKQLLQPIVTTGRFFCHELADI